jgi:hypothetical protein
LMAEMLVHEHIGAAELGGQRRHGGYLAWKGLFFEPRETPVKKEPGINAKAQRREGAKTRRCAEGGTDIQRPRACVSGNGRNGTYGTYGTYGTNVRERVRG